MSVPQQQEQRYPWDSSQQASKQAAGGGGRGYLTVSKLGDGDSYEVAIVSDSPLEFWEVWGEGDDGTKKPFRFTGEPSPADIEAELGDFKQRMNYGAPLSTPKFVIISSFTTTPTPRSKSSASRRKP